MPIGKTLKACCCTFSSIAIPIIIAGFKAKKDNANKVKHSCIQCDKPVCSKHSKKEAILKCNNLITLTNATVD